MPARGTMRCCMCGQFQPLDAFPAPSVQAVCTDCAVANVDPAFADRIRRRYGITIVEYLAMLINQRNRCAICRELRPLHVDHCHASGKVRELLCRTCNTVLGMFKDDADRLREAAEYITYHQYGGGE